MRTNILRLCVLAAWVLCGVTAAGAQNVVKKGPGLVEVTVTAMGADKDEAVRGAQRKAIEQGAGTYIYSQSKVKDFVLIRDTILTRSAGFLQSWKLLSEKETVDGLIQVKIVAVVSVKGIQDMWGVVRNLLQQMGRPKIMVFLNEKIDRRAQEDSTVQTRVERLLLDSGFALVNREQLKAIDRKDLAAAIAEDKPGRAQAIAKRFGAQLFITGSTNAALGSARKVYEVQLYRYGSDGDVKCFRSDTAQLLSSRNATSAGADQTGRVAAKKSLQALGELLGPSIQSDILRFWMDVLEGRGEVQLRVEGVTFGQSTKLKDALSALKQVKAVNRKYHNQVAEFSIQSDLNAEKLAEKIAEKVTNLEITDVSQNVIKAKLVAR